MEYLHYKTYLSMIDRCENLEIFRNFFVKKDNGEVIDLLEDGENSCATFVSSILYLNNLIKSSHATVDSTEKDIVNYGWTEYTNKEEMQKGDLIIWDKTETNPHRHIGIYIGNGLAVHNNKDLKKTVINNVNYRMIQKMFRYK